MASAKGPNQVPVTDPCAQCHDDLGSVVRNGHPAIEKTNFAGCLKCHSLAKEGDAKENKFSTRIHLAHGGAALNLDCISCHSYVPGKSFGIIGQSISWGAPKDDDLTAMKESLASWAQSSHTDHLHATAMIDCGGCHGKETPVVDATVENSRCLSCHGPLEKLAAKTTPKELPQRNPHNSHLGDIGCTVCHHAHSDSAVYCLTCHSNFGMKIPGAGQ